MMEQIVGWVVGILFIASLPYTIYFNIIQISSKWKCRKKHYNEFFNRCHESECKFSDYCQCYRHVLTEEEAAELYKKLEEYEAQIQERQNIGVRSSL